MQCLSETKARRDVAYRPEDSQGDPVLRDSGMLQRSSG